MAALLIFLVLATDPACPVGQAEQCVYVKRECKDKDGHVQCWLEPYVPREGDILLIQGTEVDSLFTIVYRTIARLTRSGPPWHSGIVIADRAGQLKFYNAPGQVAGQEGEQGGNQQQEGEEEQNRGPRYDDIVESITRVPQKVWVRSLKFPLLLDQTYRLRKWAEEQEGKPFGYLRSVTCPVLCYPVRGPMRQRSLPPVGIDRPTWFCSELVVAAGIAAGLINPQVVKPGCVNPLDLNEDSLLDLSPVWTKPCELWWDKEASESGKQNRSIGGGRILGRMRQGS